MLLRWLVNQYVGQAARQQVQRSVAEVLREAVGGGRTSAPSSPGPNSAAPQSPGDAALAPPCDAAIVFALGIESGGTVDLLAGASTARVSGFIEHAGNLRGKETVIVESGVGGQAAARAVSDVIDFHQPLWVVSAGFAGALAGELRRGHILVASEVVSAETLRPRSRSTTPWRVSS